MLVMTGRMHEAMCNTRVATSCRQVYAGTRLVFCGWMADVHCYRSDTAMIKRIFASLADILESRSRDLPLP